ncbi:MAG: YncE family protein [Flavobacteriaceae bacterium]|nr:YncE family protein [Flavobacteriaceae bacterium]
MKKLLVLLLVAFTLVSCYDSSEEEIVVESLQSVYILSEGAYGQNNASMTYYNAEDESVTQGFFELQNSRGLGDTPNDMKVYGDYMYIVVNGSHQVEVIDLLTQKSIKKIPMFRTIDGNEVGMSPRYIAFANDNAYVTSYDGYVTKIDIATLEIVSEIKVGLNPDGICVAKNKLYVCNSGGFNAPTYDNTVSVINLGTFEEIKKIVVPVNPYKIQADDSGRVFLNTRGVYPYTEETPTFNYISSTTDTLMATYDIEVSNFIINGNKAYLYSYDYVNAPSFMSFDTETQTLDEVDLLKDSSLIDYPYSINIESLSGDIYIGAAATDYVSTGSVFCFDSEGTYKFEIPTGVGPNGVVFEY